MFAIFVTIQCSCDSFLDVEIPKTRIPRSTAFADDAAANAVAAGIYINLYALDSFAGGGVAGIVSLAGLSSDELVNNPRTDLTYLEFETNQLTAKNLNILSTWTSLYRAIYSANSLMEGISQSEGISTETKRQLKGEALFIRGFCNFYLVNLFGDVPLVMTTDYKVNSKLSKASSSDIYAQIIADLIEAEELLPESYIEGERIRPNKYAVLALASRVYLFVSDWARAEDKATSVISATELYSLQEIELVFVSGSQEAIWQLKPYDNTPSTNEGATFGSYQGPLYNVLNKGVLNSFEGDDHRRVNWIRNFSSGNGELYLPYKYKKEDAVLPTTEYSIVFRLAEQFLIRAEARARQNKLDLAISDVDRIRERAGLSLIREIDPGIGKKDLLNVIIAEKRMEFLVEWGHRWLDLKRWGIADSVLSITKSQWSNEDKLYPIPDSEIRKNANMNPQNQGY
jgi:hypothetical protein